MKHYTKILFYFIALFLISFQTFAQTGTIRGEIIDDATGETLIGATAQIAGTTQGGVTDLDGKFAIENVTPGVYNLQISYVSYSTQKIENVEVKAGETTVLNIRLKSEDLGLDEIVIEAKQLKNNEAAVLTLQRKSNVVLDGVSASLFSKTGDLDAAAAMRRVTGVSVEGGKYVYVRGLGDRYSKTALNNAEIPGLDPNKNTVQMDLFPANLIDNLVVYKTFSPELPASFSGGFVNISTKDFPDQFTIQASGSLGYNLNATFNDKTLTHTLGSGHFLGFSPSERKFPSILNQNLPNIPVQSEAQRALLDQASKTPSTEFELSRYSPFMNHNLSFSIGNQVKLFGKPFGFIFGASYQRSYEYYDNGRVERYFLPGQSATEKDLSPIYLFDDERSNESVLWGSLLNLSYKFNAKNKISANFMYNQSADATTRFQDGLFPFNSGGIDESRRIETRSMFYVERSLLSSQLKGEHNLSSKNIKLDWLISGTQSQQDEPDLRFFNNLLEIQPNGDINYDIVSNNVDKPAHFWREMDETNIDTKVNLEIPVSLFKGSKIKLGGAYLAKERDFAENAYEYQPADQSAVVFNGDINALFNNYVGWVGPNQSDFGLYLRVIPGLGSYTATESVTAGYLMIDAKLTDKLNISTGARYERTDINLEMLADDIDESLRFAKLERNDILPALNLIYNISEKSNFRMGYGRTLARPTFRELAQFTTFDFLGDFTLQGNPNLERTLIDNIDLRWEIYPRAEEIISVSLFYKTFQNPIERAVNPQTNDIAIQFRFRNVDRANVLGGEIELRKRLDFLGKGFDKFSFGANVTILDSRVNIDPGELSLIRNNDPEAKDTRPLFGQAPYIINGLLSYADNDKGWTANLSFNVLGQRLTAVSVGGTPNVYEQPRPVLDFNVSKAVNRFKFKFSASNLLNGAFRFTQEFKDVKYNYQRYQVGQSFSFGVSYGFEK